MTRKELYRHITSLGLQDEVKSVCGVNYTQVSNAKLEAIVTQALAATNEAVSLVGLKPFKRLVEVLEKKHILLKSEVSYILG